MTVETTLRRPAHLVLLVAGLWLVTLPIVQHALAQRPEPTIHGTFDGDTMYTVLPPGAIPAIMEPEFLTGEDAAEQMSAGVRAESPVHC